MKHCFTLGLLLLFTAQLTIAQVTWSNRVASIIYNNCSSCHRAGGIGPFQLMNYSQAVGNALTIKSTVQDKSMPPWKPDPTYRHFKDERYLSDAEIADIASWVDNGTPRGDISSEPAPPVFSSSGSVMVSIDKTLQLPKYTVSSPLDQYRCFVIPAGNSTAKYINEIEYIPGNASIVHHIVIYKDPSNYSDSLDNLDTIPGFEGNGTVALSPNADFVGAWAPGESMFNLPTQFGIKLEPNSDYVVEVHYAPGSMGATDSSKVNIHYTNYPSVREVYIDPILNHFTTIIGGFFSFNIPANTTRTFYQRYTMPPFDASILAVFPHMHKIGTSFKIWNYNPSTADTTPIIDIPKWSFKWQGFYTFQKILKIPASSRLEAKATFDNTAANPDNPSSPPIDVYSGERTTDEMMLAFFAYTLYNPGDEDIVLDTTILSVQGPETNNASLKMRVYPNPASDVLYTEVQSLSGGNTQVQLLDAEGKIVYNEQFVLPGSDTHSLTISTHHLSPGIYMLRLYNREGKQIQQKITISK